MKTDRKERFKSAKRVVVKVGSSVLTEDWGLNIKAVKSISAQLSDLMNRGLDVILVSSGAMASGVKKIGLSKRPDEIPKRQAVAAVGQPGLMVAYEKAFAEFNKKVAQILLTSEDLNNRKRYLNARNTLNTLLEWRIVPIINENDTIMTDEITVGDNDNLAAMISLLMDADILINLTDIDGLFTTDPRTNPTAKLLSTVSVINKDIEKFAGNIPGSLNRGGMLSKIKAAKKVSASGIPMIIANGGIADIIKKLFSGKNLGTFFIPKKEKLSSRKSWIAYTLKPKGILEIDNGAAAAVLTKGKSLLPIGVVNVEGDFGVGAPVAFKNRKGAILGTGLVNYSASDIKKIMGLKSSSINELLGGKPYDEIIHRDNLVITAEHLDNL